MSEVTRRLATKESVDALTEAIQALPNATQGAADNANAAAAAATQAAESIAGIVAATYSNSSKYSVGDYVYYDGNLYRCISAIDTAEAWTAAHWTQVSIGNDVHYLRGIEGHARDLFLEQFDGISTEYSSYTKTDGYGWINNGQSQYANANWTAFEVTGIDNTKDYKIFGINVGSSSSYAVYQLDENGITIKAMLKDELEVVDQYEFIVTPMKGCKTLRYTTYKNATWDKAPQEISYVYKNYNDMDVRIRSNTSKNKIDNKRFVSQFDRVYVPAPSCTKTEGYGWINNGKSQYANPNWCAFEIASVDTSKEYKIYGVNVGSSSAYGIYQLDANNELIKMLLVADLEQLGAQEFIVSPIEGCAKIRYTTYKNPNWDKNPEEVEYRAKSEFILPSYYYANDYWKNKISSILAETCKIMNGCSFAFFTDLHMPHNQKKSPYLLKDVLLSTPVPFVICGGDIPSAYGIRDSMEEWGSEFVKWQDLIGKERFFSIRGNHDFTVKTSSSDETMAPNSGATLPPSYTYNYMIRNQERFIVSSDPENMAWYIDIPAQKTRIIGINSCDGQTNDQTASWGIYEIITQDQVDWILDKALDQDGYNYIFVSHIPSDPYFSSYSSTQAVLQAIMEALANHDELSFSDGTVTASADFTASTSKVICHIFGHGHSDGSHVLNNVLGIQTTCDALYNDDGYNGQAQTITEQAIDVFCFDYDNGTIKAIRIGRGNDRSWILE